MLILSLNESECVRQFQEFSEFSYQAEMGNPRNRSRTKSRKRKARCSAQETCEMSKKQCRPSEICRNSCDESRPGPSVISPDDQRPCIKTIASDTVETPLSRSGQKIKIVKEAVHINDDECQQGSGFVLFDYSVLAEVFACVCCPCCKTDKLTLKRCTEKRRGFCVTFKLVCELCAWENEFSSSKKVNDKTKRSSEVNVRMVLAFRNIGCGYESINNFALAMNMESPMTRKNYSKLIANLHEAYCEEAKTSMTEAVEEARNISNSNDLTVSFDGTWQKPGYASLNGVVTAISISSGKVLDFQVKSKKCKACERKSTLNRESLAYLQWQLRHSAHCAINHKGSSGSMEVEGLRDIFQRSEPNYGVRYTTFVGDGDSASHSTILGERPYGPDVIIEKKECVGHVQKRLGTRLRKLKSKLGTRKLKDGKGIGGKGRLTKRMIDKMQNYYGLAIRQNKNNLEQMIKDAMAGLYHISSSDTNPQHDMCPEGEHSWCGWQRAKATKNYLYKHRIFLPKAVMDEVLPIYKDLTDRNLLSRCLESYTQNSNESLNNLIWARCPKQVYQGRKVVELCTASAITHFNDGASSVARVLERLQICPGKNTNSAINKLDERRIQLSSKKCAEKIRRRRKQLRSIKKGLWDKEKEKEGSIYEAGGH